MVALWIGLEVDESDQERILFLPKKKKKKKEDQGSDFPEMGNQVRYQHSTFSVEREEVCFHTSHPILNHQHRPIRLQLKRQFEKNKHGGLCAISNPYKTA